MQKFSRELLTEWRKLGLPFSGETVLIAVSGGADSCALAFAIYDLVQQKKLLNAFVVGHFNHNLRGQDSIDDNEFVRNFAKELDFEFVSETASDTEIDREKNLEQSARTARYKFLSKAAKRFNSKYVLTAHTKNDQAETLLMNLIRGAGVKGLAAMRSIRLLNKNDDTQLVRPLLNWATRDDTIGFVGENDISFRHDIMNEDLDFKRVQIRKSLLPNLKEFNPKIVDILANNASVLQNEDELIGELLSQNELFIRLSQSRNLLVSELRSLSDAMLYRVLRSWLRNKRGSLRNLESVHLEAVAALINSRKSGRVVELPNYQRVVKGDGKLIFQDVEVEK